MIKPKLVGHAAHIEMINSHKMLGKPQRKKPFFAEWIPEKVVL
jgi:hypothetical protein